MKESARDLLDRTERFLTSLMEQAESRTSGAGQDTETEGQQPWSIADKLKLAATVTQFVVTYDKLDEGGGGSGFDVLRQQLAPASRKAGSRRNTNGDAAEG